MLKVHFLIFVIFAVSVIAFLGVNEAFAGVLDPEYSSNDPTPVDELFCDTQNLISGNVGTLIGLGVAFFGFILLILKGDSKGLVLLITGLAVTAFPGLLMSFIEGMSNASSETDSIKIQSCPSFKSPKLNYNPIDAMRSTSKGSSY